MSVRACVCVCVTLRLSLHISCHFFELMSSVFVFSRFDYIIKMLFIFFLFRLLPLSVATAVFPSSFGPIFCLLLRHFNHCHVLSHRIINLLLGLPRFLFPDSSILSILPPIYPSSFLRTCPNHLSLASRVFSKPSTCAVPLMYSCLIKDVVYNKYH